MIKLILILIFSPLLSFAGNPLPNSKMVVNTITASICSLASGTYAIEVPELAVFHNWNIRKNTKGDYSVSGYCNQDPDMDPSSEEKLKFGHIINFEIPSFVFNYNSPKWEGLNQVELEFTLKKNTEGECKMFCYASSGKNHVMNLDVVLKFSRDTKFINGKLVSFTVYNGVYVTPSSVVQSLYQMFRPNYISFSSANWNIEENRYRMILRDKGWDRRYRSYIIHESNNNIILHDVATDNGGMGSAYLGFLQDEHGTDVYLNTNNNTVFGCTQLNNDNQTDSFKGGRKLVVQLSIDDCQDAKQQLFFD
ncbi:MAG: hypothetical protein AB8E15_09555 [Bdellovibrionales bacterium]